MMNAMAIAAVCCAVTVGCAGRDGADPMPPAPAPATAPVAAPAPTAAPVEVLTADEVFAQLTRSVWMFGDRGRFPDFTLFRFRADGSYSIEHGSDTPSWKKDGKWNLQRAADGTWFVCVDSGVRYRFGRRPGGKIALTTLMVVWPDAPLAYGPSLRAADLPKIELPPDVRARADRITAHAWKRANDFNLNYNPTSVRFNPDWTYTSTYRYGECSNRGGWYASSDGDLATSPVSPCDHRSRVVGSPDTGEWLALELLGPDELMV